jgi:ABC-type Fe3+/spermidine/putrescine transport system ATPase subunit
MQVELSNICFSYGRNAPAGLNNLSLSVEKGQFIALLGPSGCGKTTTLKLLAGLLRPQSGTIRIAGKDVTSLGPEKRNASMVFQNYALFPHLTVEQNVGFGLRMKGQVQEGHQRTVDDVLGFMGLTDLRKKLPKELSGGQQQRVGVARAVVTQPDILLMDEPLSNLDSRLRERMTEEISRIQRELKLSVVYVTHDRHEAMAMADLVVVMEGGKIVDAAGPRALYSTPKSVASAMSLGDANVFSSDELKKWEATGAHADVPVKNGATYIVRPENFTVVLDPHKGPSALHRCVVKSAAFRGDRMRLQVHVEALAKELVVQLTDSALFAHVERGSTIYLGTSMMHMAIIEPARAAG